MTIKSTFYSMDGSKPPFVSGSLLTNKKFLQKNVPTTPENAENFIREQNVYTLYRSAKRKFPRNHYRITYMNELWEIDLLDMTALAEHNNGYKYLLVVVDAFSKFAWVRPMRTKTASEAIKQFSDIITQSKQKPRVLQSDRGGELTGHTFTRFLTHKNIKHQFPTTTLPAKCAIVENLNRILRQIITRFLFVHNTKRYIHVLQQLVDGYNNTPQSRTKFAPAKINASNAVQVYHNTHLAHRKQKTLLSRFRVGDFVRVIEKQKTFKKPTFTPQWSKEIFRVVKIIHKQFPTYAIASLDGQPIKGHLYGDELQKIYVSPDTPYKRLTRNIFDTARKGQIHAQTFSGEKRWFNVHDIKDKDKETSYSHIIDNLLKKR